MRRLPLISLLCALAAALLWGCGNGGDTHQSTDSAAGHLPDTLRVATLYSPTSYFIYRDQPMGYDYSLASRFAADKGLQLDLVVAPNLGAMLEMLDSGLVDLIAYEIPITAEYRQRVIACGPVNETHQVLVQPRKKGYDVLTDVTQLVGRDIYVEKDSKYQYRLQNLNNELGGGINIHLIDRDTLITEDMIEMVSTGDIPLTVVDSDIARLNSTYYHDLDISLRLSFPQRAAWGVAPGNRWLADSIDAWIGDDSSRKARASLLKRYFEMSKADPDFGGYAVNLASGRISPYDALFRRHAKSIDWDWRLLASMGYAESHFDSTRVSWAGALGVMQIMPATARAYGSSAAEVVNPDKGIATAARILADLDRRLAASVPDQRERVKFVLAAYNSGIAHIRDAIALAQKHGHDPRVWDGNVAEALLLKSNPEYFNDPVCRFGYFRGRETVDYVRKVTDFYSRARTQIPL